MPPWRDSSLLRDDEIDLLFGPLRPADTVSDTDAQPLAYRKFSWARRLIIRIWGQLHGKSAGT